MNILIVGAGVVGVSLAEQLSEEGHRVSVVDRDRRKARELREKLDVLTVNGNGGSPSVLKRAGIDSAAMVIAVTDTDEVNIIVGMLAARMGVKHRIARVRNPEYQKPDCVLSPKELGIEQIINPDPSIVQAMTRMIEIPGSHNVASLAGGQVLMLGFDIEDESPAAGVTLAELGELAKLVNFLILYITRGDKVMVPKGNHTLESGDKVTLLVSADTVKLLQEILLKKIKPMKNVIITGASRTGIQLAEAIRDKVDRVTLIEPDPEVAEETASQLPKTKVLEGDETDLDVLEEASIDRCDLFCALSDDDQRNMLASLLAKKHGAAKTAVLVHQPDFVAVMESLGAEIVINPRLVMVGEILMHVRKGHIHSVTRLPRGQAEIIEMECPEGCPATKSPLKSLKFPEDALVGAIVRNGAVSIPDGDTRIQPGDRVLVFSLPDSIPRIEKMFSRKRRI